MTKPRKGIPEAVKREVRQRDGFGCITCGYPIITYHHLIPHADGGPDTTTNLVLLCHRCHTNYHSGLISEQKLLDAKSAPAAFGDAQLERLRINPRYPIVNLGQQQFGFSAAHEGKSFSPIVILDRKPITVRCERGFPLISLELQDRKGGSALKIVENEVCIDTGVYDVEWRSNRVIVRLQKSLIVLELYLGDMITVRRGIFVYKEYVIWIDGFLMYLNCLQMYSELQVTDFAAGLAVGDSQACCFLASPVYFDYQDIKDSIKGEKYQIHLPTLAKVVKYYGLPQNKSAPNQNDTTLYRSSIAHIKRPAWLKVEREPTGAFPKYRDLKRGVS